MGEVDAVVRSSDVHGSPSTKRSKYFDYRPTGVVLFEERQREKVLTEQGWTFIRIEWKDLFNEVEFKYRVLRALNGGPGAIASPFRRPPAG